MLMEGGQESHRPERSNKHNHSVMATDSLATQLLLLQTTLNALDALEVLPSENINLVHQPEALTS